MTYFEYEVNPYKYFKIKGLYVRHRIRNEIEIC